MIVAPALLVFGLMQPAATCSPSLGSLCQVYSSSTRRVRSHRRAKRGWQRPPRNRGGKHGPTHVSTRSRSGGDQPQVRTAAPVSDGTPLRGIARMRFYEVCLNPVPLELNFFETFRHPKPYARLFNHVPLDEWVHGY